MKLANLAAILGSLLLVWLLVGMPGYAGVSSTRKPLNPLHDFDWICQGADGTFISGHTRQDKAQEACTNRALLAPGGVFLVVPGANYEVQATVPPAVSLPGNRGTWSWVAPTTLENGNILTDLDRFLMYRQPAGGQPEVFAQINGKATSLVWGMDTAYANACFWFVAVRKPATSLAVPSDKSNVICMDAQGQPLPTA